jgi:general secretion pathway protein K
MVIWLLAFFSIVLAAFAFSMRTELAAARSFKDEAGAAALAEAGISRAIAELTATQSKVSVGPITPPPTSWEGTLGTGTYRAVLTEEESKLPVNRVTEDVWRRLLRNTGVKDQQLVDTIVDSILDWIDADDLHRLHGAESDYYRGLPHPYHAKNGEIEFLDELLLVRGMTREILNGTVSDPSRLEALLQKLPEEREFQSGEYLGIRSFLAVQPIRPNPSKAGLDVMLAMGISPAEAMSTLQRRKDVAGAAQSIPGAAGQPGALSPGTFGVESTGQIAGSPLVYRITAILQRDIVQGRPRIRVLSWQEGA